MLLCVAIDGIEFIISHYNLASHAERLKVFIGILFVVPDERRRIGILKTTEAEDMVPLVWVALQEAINRPGDLSAMIWKVTAHSPQRCLQE